MLVGGKTGKDSPGHGLKDGLSAVHGGGVPMRNVRLSPSAPDVASYYNIRIPQLAIAEIEHGSFSCTQRYQQGPCTSDCYVTFEHRSWSPSSDMSLPAAERVPVELWLRIIHFALASRLSPAPGNDILDYRDAFLTVCDSDQASLEHENNAASFRLVCKSWDATVKKIQQKMILCDFGKRRRNWEPGVPYEDVSKPEFVPLHLFQKPTPSHGGSGQILSQGGNVEKIKANLPVNLLGRSLIMRTLRTHVGLKGGLRGLLRKSVLSRGQSLANLSTPIVSPTGLPAVTRIEAWTPEGYCYCFRPTCRYKNVSTSRDHPARDLPLAFRNATSASTIESLLIGMKVDENYLCSLLDVIPSLRALSCRIRDRPIWKTVLQLATCQGLTHLQIRVSWAPFCRSLSHVSLPELVYLGIIFHLPPDTSDYSNPPLNVEWCTQPKLRYLELEGTILDCRRDEFYAFLSVERPNLSGLILRVHLPNYGKLEYLNPPNLWVSCPSLASFGVEMASLHVKPLPPAPNVTSVDIILFFGTVDVWYPAQTPVNEFFESIRGMCNEWKPKRIVLPTTWEAEEEFVKGFEFTKEPPKAFYLPHYVQFFQVLKQEGITVVDREGRSTGTVDGRRYVKSLEECGFDKYGTGLMLREAWRDSLPEDPFEDKMVFECCMRSPDSD